jgi:hypothetical protein
MTRFYVGRCPECNTARAGAVAEYAEAQDIMAMLDSGLVVTKERQKNLTVQSCEHKDDKRWIRVR